MSRLFLIFILIMLAGCRTWDKKSCDQIDFVKYGYLDASEGNPYGGFNRYDFVRDCSTADKIRYKALYDQGVEDYQKKICNLAGGEEYGRAGFERWNGMCAKYDLAGFTRGFESGAKDHKIKELEKKLRKAKEANACRFDSDCKKTGRCSFGQCVP